MSVHENVRKIRLAKGITQAHISKVLGLTPQGYMHIEKGNVSLSTERLNIISKAFDINDMNIFFDDKLVKKTIDDLSKIKKQGCK